MHNIFQDWTLKALILQTNRYGQTSVIDYNGAVVHMTDQFIGSGPYSDTSDVLSLSKFTHTHYGISEGKQLPSPVCSVLTQGWL